MSTPLTRFLAAIATDPDLLAEYLRDKDKVIREAGLPQEDVAALRSGDRSTVVARLDSLVPMPTVQVAISVSAELGGPAQVITQVPTWPVYDTGVRIPTVTHLVIMGQAERQASVRAHSAGVSTGEEGTEPSAKDQASEAQSVRRLTH